MSITNNDGSPASNSWEDAETQPQLLAARRQINNSTTNNNGNNIRTSLNSSSLDLDKTLPLPPDVEAELRESQRVYGRQNNDSDDDDEAMNNAQEGSTKMTLNEKKNEGLDLLTKLQAWTSPHNSNNNNTLSSSSSASARSLYLGKSNSLG